MSPNSTWPCPYTKRKFRQRDTRGACTQRKDHVRPQKEETTCKPRRVASEETKSEVTLSLTPLASRTVAIHAYCWSYPGYGNWFWLPQEASTGVNSLTLWVMHVWVESRFPSCPQLQVSTEKLWAGSETWVSGAEGCPAAPMGCWLESPQVGGHLGTWNGIDDPGNPRRCTGGTDLVCRSILKVFINNNQG